MFQNTHHSHLKNHSSKISKQNCTNSNFESNPKHHTAGNGHCEMTFLAENSDYNKGIYKATLVQKIKKKKSSAINNGAIDKTNLVKKLNKKKSFLGSVESINTLTLKSPKSFSINNRQMCKCIYCEFSTTNRVIFSNHTKTHLRDNLFHCLYCDYQSPLWRYITNHHRRHNRVKLKCHLCKFSTHRNNNLVTHITHVHSTSKGIS